MASTPPVTRIPNPAELSDDLPRVLAVLSLAKAADSGAWLTAAEISKALRDDHNIPLHWRTAATLLEDNKALVHRRKRQGRWQYSLSMHGEEVLVGTAASITVIDPTQSVHAVLSLHALLGGLKGVVRVCDPYLDYTTVEHLDACRSAAELRLLTHNVKDSGPLRRVVAVMVADGRNLQIRRVASAVLHDRYVIADDCMYTLGTSLNGFGKKQSFITAAGEDVRAQMIAYFDNLWGTAAPWP